jgi:hypothetical protein
LSICILFSKVIDIWLSFEMNLNKNTLQFCSVFYV